MKKPILLAASAVIALTAAATIAVAERGGDGWKRGHGGGDRMEHRARGDHDGRGHGRGRGAGLMQMLEAYDTDGDGGLTQEEINAARAAQLAEFDTNGDGSLSLDEYEALWLDVMRERMVDRFQSHDDDGDGSVTVAEFGEQFERFVDRADRNGDGVVNAEDLGRAGRRAAPQDGASE